MADVADLKILRKPRLKMPRSIRVGHRVYEVVRWEKKAALASGAMGDCREDPPVIRVSKDLKPFDTAEVLLHEIFHTGWGRLPERASEEEAVDTLAGHFAAVIADNPDLLPWLSANLKRTA